MENFNVSKVLNCLLNLGLEISHSHVFSMDLISFPLNSYQLIRFSFEEVANILGISGEPISVVSSNLLCLVELHSVLKVILRFLRRLLIITSHVLFKLNLQFLGFFPSFFGIIQTLFHLIFVVIFGIVQFGRLISYSIDLGIQDELFANNVKLHFAQFLLPLIKIFSHLHVLGLEKVDMLMRCLLIIEEAANAGLFLILNNFLLQDFELKLHKVDLLLKISNVFVLNARVWISSKSIFFCLILTSELDSVS